jgi:hypothetical protein
MFDVIEHIPNPISFLSKVSNHCRFALLLTPMETGGEWSRTKHLPKSGNEHPDGHINFFTPEIYLKLLEESGMRVVSGRLIYSLASFGNAKIIYPEDYNKSIKQKLFLSIIRGVPYSVLRKIFGGGLHICLIQSMTVSSA